ncbi:MAG: TonB-dependent receptor [Balneolaceae bacterium]|nr:MAG: TonB-dependent receptor [Balneolaceae bacterium]
MESTTNTCRAVQKSTSEIITVFVLSVLMLFSINTVQAQTNVYADDFLNSNILQARAMPNLNIVVNFEFQNTPILEALGMLAESSSLDLNYNRHSLDQNIMVNKSFQGVNLLDALQEITTEAGMHFYISDSGQLILTPEELPSNTGTLSGQVQDASNNEPLIGTTIYISELERGDVVDADGYFEITGIPEGRYTIRITSVGYQTKTQRINIVADQELELALSMEQDRLLLDEIVVTGYSIRQRSLPTGSLTRVEGNEFREALIQSPDQALQGRMSGVLVSHSSGQPGSGLLVRVRGLGSINASNSPIYIIDGVQVRTDHTSVNVPDNALATINPNDIESIEVLKDASATAMYGAQGANGVVLITTRQAERGQTQINVSSQIGFNEQPEPLDIMDGPTWTETMIQGYVNRQVDRGRDDEESLQLAIERYGDPATAPTYDWQDALTRAGMLNQFNLSASAGLENTRIYLSGAYDFEEGAVLASDFSSLRFRSNIDHSFNDRFTVATRLSVASSTANGLRAGSANITSPFHGGYTQRPIDAIFTEDGGYNHNDFIRINLVQQLNEDIRQTSTRQFRGSLTGVYRFLDNLSFRSLWGLDYRTNRDRLYRSALLPRYIDLGGTLTERYRETVSFNTNQIVEFEQNFDQHNLNVLAGFEYRFNDRQSISARGSQFPNPVFTQLDLAAEDFSVSGRTSQSKFAGFFTRADYNYNGRYFVSANLRYDGSSRFGQQNQWGLFYSGALAWDIAREEFMQGINFLDQLKLKTSFGITGNSAISDFAARSLFGSGGNYEGNTGLRPSGLGNDLLTWEEAQTLDIGIEFSVLGDRFFGEIGWFNTRNKNLLLNAFLPTDSGFSSIARNSGVVENVGWEIELGARWVSKSTFNWTTNFNFTHQKNEILELVDGLEILGSSIRVGYPIGILWRNKYAGINPADGRVMWYDIDGNITYRRSSDDRQMVGKYSPDYFGGLTNVFNYRNFRLSTFFQYEYGRSTYNSTVGRRMQVVSSERGLMANVARDAWQQPGDMAGLPRHYTSSSFPGSSSHNHSSVFITDASYIRLKEMRLDYNIPLEWVEKISLNRANVFVQARNLVTWTNYPYGDPEFVGQGTGEYPQSRQISLGINFQF